MGIEVHSNVGFDGKVRKGEKPRYWVTRNGETLFESESAGKTLQWAIDYTANQTIFPSKISPIEIKTPIHLKSGEQIKGKKKVEWEVK